MDLNRLTNEAYNAYVKAKAKPSPMGKNLVWAFLVGGGICLVGQALLDGYASLGLDLTQANAVVAPAMEFKQEGMITGTAAKLFTVAGPVLVYGISASVVYGVVLYIAQRVGG